MIIKLILALFFNYYSNCNISLMISHSQECFVSIEPIEQKTTQVNKFGIYILKYEKVSKCEAIFWYLIIEERIQKAEFEKQKVRV